MAVEEPGSHEDAEGAGAAQEAVADIASAAPSGRGAEQAPHGQPQNGDEVRPNGSARPTREAPSTPAHANGTSARTQETITSPTPTSSDLLEWLASGGVGKAFQFVLATKLNKVRLASMFGRCLPNADLISSVGSFDVHSDACCTRLRKYRSFSTLNCPLTALLSLSGVERACRTFRIAACPP